MLKCGWDTKKTELVNLTRFGWSITSEILVLSCFSRKVSVSFYEGWQHIVISTCITLRSFYSVVNVLKSKTIILVVSH